MDAWMHMSEFVLIGITGRTRPFLSDIEKQWLIYQLLVALDKMSFYGLYHGDIKSENVMVTSLGWVFLTDFASYKPVYISEVHAHACRQMWLWLGLMPTLLAPASTGCTRRLLLLL